MRIALEDQPQPPGPLPALDPLFANDRVFDALVPLDIDQPGQTPLAAELRAPPFAMLMDARREVGGDAGVERAVRPVRDDVNPAADWRRIVSSAAPDR